MKIKANILLKMLKIPFSKFPNQKIGEFSILVYKISLATHVLLKAVKEMDQECINFAEALVQLIKC